MEEGPPIRKKNVMLGGPTFYRCTDVITLPLLHLLLRVRLLWVVCAKTRRYSQNSTVLNSIDLAAITRRLSQNLMVFAGLDIIMLVVQLIHSAHSIVIKLISVKNILNHSTHIIDECVFCG